MMIAPKLSIIVVSFNTKTLLDECLTAVYRSKEIDEKELEVIVVDNNSSDGSSEIVSKKFTQSKLIKNKENAGYSAANNKGIMKAMGKFILLLNSDAIVERGTIKTMLDFMEHHPEAGASTCRVELSNGTLDPACHRGFPTPWNAFAYFLGLEKLFPKSRLFAGYHQGWKNVSTLHDVDVISGAFFLVRREVIDQVGLLDEQFFMYGEDIDWSYRMKQAGFRILFNPRTSVLHHKKQSGRNKREEGEPKKKAEYHFIHTMEQFYRKHYANKYPRLISELVFLALRIKKFFL